MEKAPAVRRNFHGVFATVLCDARDAGAGGAAGHSPAYNRAGAAAGLFRDVFPHGGGAAQEFEACEAQAILYRPHDPREHPYDRQRGGRPELPVGGRCARLSRQGRRLSVRRAG